MEFSICPIKIHLNVFLQDLGCCIGLSMLGSYSHKVGKASQNAGEYLGQCKEKHLIRNHI